jgi:ACS family tartrate transporter-like MFS transporter
VRARESEAVDDEGVMRRLFRRLLPFLFAAMFFNYLDRINIAFAALHMNAALGLGPAVFGLGGSIFFAGYMVLQVPSNLLLHRLGARVWLGTLLIAWGAIAAATAFVRGAHGFYLLRFALGLAEAGYLPGVAVYVARWFPESHRARAVARYIIAGQVAAVVGGPVSAALMEGLDAAETARLLALVREGEAETDGEAGAGSTPWRGAPAPRRGAPAPWRDLRVGWLALLFGSALVGVYGLLLWLPQILRAMGVERDLVIGGLSALPPLIGVGGSLLVGASSDRHGERRRHLALVYLLAALGFAGSALAPPVGAYLLICLASFGLNAGNALFWSLATRLGRGRAQAVAIALVNTLAQFGGLIGPAMIGWVREASGGFAAALALIAAFLAAAALLAWFFPEHRPERGGPARAPSAPEVLPRR